MSAHFEWNVIIICSIIRQFVFIITFYEPWKAVRRQKLDGCIFLTILLFFIKAALFCSQTLGLVHRLGSRCPNLSWSSRLVFCYVTHNHQCPLVGGLCFPKVLSVLTTWRDPAALGLRYLPQDHVHDTSDSLTMPGTVSCAQWQFNTDFN